MKRVLITGGFGFIGSHLVEHLLANTNWHLTLLASFLHGGDSARGMSFIPNARVTVFTHDCTTPISAVLAALIGPVDYIINAAAESHVDRSITNPVPFVQNNVNIALATLEYARAVKPAAFVQVSTDEIYGPAPVGIFHKEWDVVKPSNPYSASKAAQEALAISYWRTYDVPVILTNTMNNFGERQHKEKFTAKLINKIALGETLDIHASADGTIGSRFYMHARNHADAILYLLQNTTPTRSRAPVLEEVTQTKKGHLQPHLTRPDRPDRYNIVGDEELNNLELAQLVAGYMGRELSYKLVDFHSSRPGHDLRYALDGTKMRAAGWKAPVDLRQSLKKTVQWTLEHPEWL